MGKKENEERYLNRLRNALQNMIRDLQSQDWEDSEIRFTLPAWPSKKNKRVGHRPSPIAMKSQRMIATALKAAFGRRAPLHRSCDVKVTIEFDSRPQSKSCLVVVRPMRPKNPEWGDRYRDPANLPELILDAMEGSIYENDNQVADLQVVRLYSGQREHEDAATWDDPGVDVRRHVANRKRRSG